MMHGQLTTIFPDSATKITETDTACTAIHGILQGSTAVALNRTAKSLAYGT